MADNTTLASASGGDVLRTEDKPSLSAKVPVSLIDVAGTSDSESIIGNAGVTMPVGGLVAEDGAVSGNPVLIGGRFDSSARTLDNGDVGSIALAADGAIHIDDGGNAITVDNAGTFAIQVVDTSFAVADGNALGEGVLVQGDDGTDRKNINVDAGTGDVQVDVTNTVTVAAHAVTNAGTFAIQVVDTSFAVADGNALGEGVLVQGDDGTDRKNINVDSSTGDVQVDVTEVISGTGQTNLGKAQDVAVGANDTGVAMLVKRDDEEAVVTPADSDYVVATCDKFGKIKVTQLPDATSVVKFAFINAASGDNEIVAAVGAGVKIRVLNVVCVAGGTTDCRFESNPGGTALTGIMKLVANSGFAPGYCPVGHFETADNESLSLECTGDIDGWVSYVEV